MIGPHHSIICCFTGTGQGAAAWMATRRDDRSCARRCASGSLSMRTNIVGTTCVCVMRCSGTRRRNSAASKCSITTTVPPRRITAIAKRSGAAWYSGPGDRYTVPGPMLNGPMHTLSSELTKAMSVDSGGTYTPLGRPVVPDE